MAARTGACLLIFLMACGTALAADERQPPNPSPGLFQGTQQEQAACNPDAVKFCIDAIPDSFRVLACLQNHRPRLTKACLHVLESHAQ